MLARRQGVTVLIGVLIGIIFTLMVSQMGDWTVVQQRSTESEARQASQCCKGDSSSASQVASGPAVAQVASGPAVAHVASAPVVAQVNPSFVTDPDTHPMKSCMEDVLWPLAKVKRLQLTLDSAEEKDVIAFNIECIRITLTNPSIFTQGQGALSYKICLHDDVSDPAISANLRKGQIYEQKNLELVAKHLTKYPGSGFIDIGANMGLFSLLAAKLGHPVVAVDPRPDNLLRLRTALIGEPSAQNVIVLQNAVSDVRTRMHLMTARQQQGHTIVVCKDKCITTKGGICNNATVDSIYLDDVIPSVRNLNIEKAIVKMDIEGHEAHALAVSDELFKAVDIRMLLMEWKFFRHSQRKEDADMAIRLVQKMQERQFVATDPRNERPLAEDWTLWPVDMAWVKQ